MLQAGGLVVVGQDGVVHYLLAASEIQEVASRKQHELEAWCVEVSSMDKNLILTGTAVEFTKAAFLSRWDLCNS